jgi:hypothetical protein
MAPILPPQADSTNTSLVPLFTVFISCVTMDIVFKLTTAKLDLKQAACKLKYSDGAGCLQVLLLEMQQLKSLIHTNRCQLVRLEMQKLARPH